MHDNCKIYNDNYFKNKNTSNQTSSNSNVLLVGAAAVSAQLFHHFVEAVARIVLHVVPKVDRDAFVALAHVVVPEGRQVQDVTGVDAYLVGGGARVLREAVQVRSERIDADPLDEPGVADFCGEKENRNI